MRMRRLLQAHRSRIAISTAMSFGAVVVGCGNSTRPPSAGHVEQRGAHFDIVSDGVDSASVGALLASLEQDRPRIVSDLETTSLGRTRIVIQSKDAFDAEWRSTIQHAGIGFQVQGLTGPDGTIYIYGPWAAQHAGRGLQQVALHELAHAATNRSAVDYVAANGGDTIAYAASAATRAARMRWLSETIAVYEAKQATDLNSHWYLIRGRYPSIADLNDPTKGSVYEIGYRLADFIRAQWGPDALVRLVHHDGDVQATFGISNDELMHRWFLYAENRYLLIKPRWFGR